jgi:hypothetical protein
VICQASQSKQQIGQPIEIGHEEFGDRAILRQRNNTSLGATANRTSEVQGRSLGSSCGEDKGAKRRQFSIGLVDEALELTYPLS